MTAPASTGPEAPARKVLVYSDKRHTRDQVRLALGRQLAPDLPPIDIVEAATEPVVIGMLDDGGLDVVVLDGEASPAGGLGICRQLKDEIFNCPPVLVLIGRPQDGWLATWSRADGVVSHPLDPMALAAAVAELLRQRLARVPSVT